MRVAALEISFWAFFTIKKKTAVCEETTSVGPVCRMANISVFTGNCRRMLRLVETGCHTLLRGVSKCVLHEFFIFIDRFPYSLAQTNLNLLMSNIFGLRENRRSERHTLRMGVKFTLFSTVSSDVDTILYGRCPQPFSESL